MNSCLSFRFKDLLEVNGGGGSPLRTRLSADSLKQRYFQALRPDHRISGRRSRSGMWPLLHEYGGTYQGIMHWISELPGLSRYPLSNTGMQRPNPSRFMRQRR